jgi:Tol biopolymer transport system component
MLRGGEPKQVTQGVDPVGSVEWSPVEDRIAYDVARGGGFNAQVYYSKPDGTDVKRITSGGKEDNFSGAFAQDGPLLLSAPRSAIRSCRIRGSTTRRPTSRRWQSSRRGSAASSDIQRPAKRALLSRLVTRGNDNYYLHDLQTHQEILLTPHEGPALGRWRARAGWQRGLPRAQPRARSAGRCRGFRSMPRASPVR